MGNIANRSPWVVKIKGEEEQKFRLKSKAIAWLNEKGVPVEKAKLTQLETAFEVQIKLKDRKGNTVYRRNTLPSLKEAEKWMKDEEESLLTYRERAGNFVASFETMTVKEALEKCWEEHYKNKSSAEDYLYRVQVVSEILGEHTLFRTLNSEKMIKLRNELQAMNYSASSVRNFFTLVSRTLTRAKGEWLFPIENYAKGLSLPKPKNAKNRQFKGDERERLFEAIDRISPWLRPIVELSLEIAFRRGEIVQQGRKRRERGVRSGLEWEGVDFEKNVITIFQEKNDWQKGNTEELGRKVPMPPRAKEILLKLWNETPEDQRTGLIFKDRTVNSVTQAFKNCCEKARPPIENLTFHSCRKIGTYELSKKVSNAILLSKITGHKDINTLAQRYYSVPLDDLNKMLRVDKYASKDEKAIDILTKNLGLNETILFLLKVNKAKDIEEFIKLINE